MRIKTGQRKNTKPELKLMKELHEKNSKIKIINRTVLDKILK
jgi:hypothetical protein